MAEQRYDSAPRARRLGVGPLAPHIDGFSALLAQDGYAPATVRGKRQLIDELSRWLH